MHLLYRFVCSGLCFIVYMRSMLTKWYSHQAIAVNISFNWTVFLFVGNFFYSLLRWENEFICIRFPTECLDSLLRMLYNTYQTSFRFENPWVFRAWLMLNIQQPSHFGCRIHAFFGIIANADSVIYINLYGAQFFFFFFYILCALISENSLKIGSTRTFIKSARYRAEMLKIWLCLSNFPEKAAIIVVVVVVYIGVVATKQVGKALSDNT